MLLPQWPYYSEEEIEKVKEILSSGRVNYWTGNEGRSFEDEFASETDTKHALAMANGSLALSASYLSIGLGKGDEIITTPRTFIATASSAALLGAKPIFADVDIDSGCINTKTIEPLITKKTKAISVVHLGGWPCDMEDIYNLARTEKINLIEDCAQAHGASVYGRPVGSFGDVSAWSFCQDKIISTGGEGGMITTNNKKYWDLIWSFKDHGKTIEATQKNNAYGFQYIHERLGSNFRLTEIQSAIGRIQLNKLKDWNSIRTRNAMLLREILIDIPGLRIPIPPDGYKHAWYKFHCYIEPNYLSSDWSRDRLIQSIKDKGFPAYYGSCSEIYLEKCFLDKGLAPSIRLKNAKKLGETSLMFLVHPTISKEIMIKYAQTVKKVIMQSII